MDNCCFPSRHCLLPFNLCYCYCCPSSPPTFRPLPIITLTTLTTTRALPTGLEYNGPNTIGHSPIRFDTATTIVDERERGARSGPSAFQSPPNVHSHLRQVPWRPFRLSTPQTASLTPPPPPPPPLGFLGPCPVVSPSRVHL